MTSSFGRGFATCLLQFTFHEPRLAEYVGAYADVRAAGRHADYFTDGHAAAIWANGAADHLIELLRPRRNITRSEWERAKAIADLTYDAGRSLDGRHSVADMEDALRDARSLLAAVAGRAGRDAPKTLDEAMDLDRVLGLRPERGDTATCEAPIPSRTSR